MVHYHRKTKPLGTAVSCCQRIDQLERKKVSFNSKEGKMRTRNFQDKGPKMEKTALPGSHLGTISAEVLAD